MGSETDGNLTYLRSEILRAERKEGFVSELGSLERKVFQNTVVNKKHFFKKLTNIILGVSENLVNIFGVFEKFGQHIWGPEEMA